MSEPHNQFRYDMTNFRSNLSMVSHEENLPQDLNGPRQEMLFIQQMNNPISIRHIFILFGQLNIAHMCKSNIV